MTESADIPRLEDCEFYHVLDLPGFGPQGGPSSWDLRGRFAEYTGHVDLNQKTVLDVGAASGFLTFEAERHGGTVTSYDVAGPEHWQSVPYPSVQDTTAYFRLMRNSYLFAHHALNSRARLVTGDIYKLAENVEPHDVSIVGQILVHLRDPLEALRQISLVTKERMVIVEGSFESHGPTAVFLGGKGNYYSWWHLSEQLYREYLPILGFEVERVGKAQYKCNDLRLLGDVEVWTFVAKRTSPPSLDADPVHAAVAALHPEF